MAKSFFEKLTGASTEAEEEEVPTEKEKKSIKEDSLDMPKPKPEKKSMKKPKTKKTIKKIEQMDEEVIKEEEEKEKEEEKKEEKDWLEEAEGEEGQLTIDVYQTDSDIVIKSTIAGVSPEDVDISITNDMVTIRGKRAKDEKIETENYYYQELYWGSFSRSVILPVEVEADRAKATIKNGILTIKLPKSEKIKTKKIRVSATE